MRTLADATNASVVAFQGRAGQVVARDLRSLLLPTTLDDAQRTQTIVPATSHLACGTRSKLRHTATAVDPGGHVIHIDLRRHDRGSSGVTPFTST
jgi:hypothetical protein